MGWSFVVVYTPTFSRKETWHERDILAYAVKLIKIVMASGSPFLTRHEYKFHTETPPPARQTAIVGCPKVRKCNMLEKQLHNSIPEMRGMTVYNFAQSCR